MAILGVRDIKVKSGGGTGIRSCEKINNLTQRRKVAKVRKQQLLYFLCLLCDFASLREMLLPVQELFHTFCGVGILPARSHGQDGHATTRGTGILPVCPERERDAPATGGEAPTLPEIWKPSCQTLRSHV